MLVFLYLFIFILLSLNDYAYLAGNIGLFFLLSVTMAVSTKLGLFNSPAKRKKIVSLQTDRISFS